MKISFFVCQFFSLDVYDGFGKALSVKQLISQLENIVARSTRPTLPVGILTSQHRNVWGKAYKALARGGQVWGKGAMCGARPTRRWLEVGKCGAMEQCVGQGLQGAG